MNEQLTDACRGGRTIERARSRPGATSAALLGLLAWAVIAEPATIEVGDGCTLADAITAANTDAPVGACTAGSGADEIVLSGDVELLAALPPIESEIAIEGSGFEVSRSEAAPPFRILEVSGNPTGHLELRNATLRNGMCPSCCGGAIRAVAGDVTILDSRLEGNSADTGGGGLCTSGSDIVLANTTVSGNSTALAGGGVARHYGTLTITESTISGNYAGLFGGGVEIQSYTFQETTIVNTTISGNSIGGFGGGGIHMGVYSSNAVLTYSTVSGNSGYASIYVYPGAMAVASSIVGNHEGAGSDCSGIVAGAGNLDDDGTCGGDPITGLDPVLADNGGPTLTHALLEDSSAIDAAGDCALEIDQRGFARSDGACDSGSFEFGADVPIPCADVESLQARCNPAGTIQVRVKFTDTSHSGETVTIGLDGEPHERTIFGKVASFQEPGAGAGPHTITLDDPPGCFAPVVKQCAVAARP